MITMLVKLGESKDELNNANATSETNIEMVSLISSGDVVVINRNNVFK